MKVLTLLLVVLTVTTANIFSQTKGMRVVSVKDDKGQSIDLYERSHALLVGVSKYTEGWPNLESVPSELEKIEAALKQNGFTVRKIVDPNSEQLNKAFEQFVKDYGYDKGNRLLFVYSGHGWSRKNGEQGYLVPSDAPDPLKDEKAFLRSALDMTDILGWCKKMEAKHALFLFDSCFSGAIFKTRALPEKPPHITALTTKPVRQFISAGEAGQVVPAKSVFATCFLRGLSGEADLSKDGYITGTELGMFLHDKVIYYKTGQTPQYGKMRDPDLDEGDFVFLVNPPSVEFLVTTERASVSTSVPVKSVTPRDLSKVLVGTSVLSRDKQEKIELPDQVFRQSGAFSFGGWFRTKTQVGDGNMFAVISMYNAVRSPADGYSTCLNGDGTLTFSMIDPKGETQKVSSPDAVDNGAWHHHVAVWDGSRMVLYIDGRQAAVTTTRNGGPKYYHSHRPAIGGVNTYGDNWVHHFNGSVGDCFVVGRALLSGEVVALYSTQKPQKASEAE